MRGDSLTQIPWKKKSLLILDAPEHVDSGNMKFKIGRRSSVYQLFSKCDITSMNVAEIGKKWPKNDFFWKSLILYCIRSKNVWDVFYDLKMWKKPKKVLKSVNFAQCWPILATFYEFKSRFEKSW
jgi:hypothetical protein